MVARFFVCFWLTLAAYLWLVMTGYDLDLLASGVMISLLTAYLSCQICRASWRGFRKVICGHPVTTGIFGVVVVTTGLFSSRLAGDLAPAHRVAATCIMWADATLHLHHLPKGLVIVAWHLPVLALLCPDGCQVPPRLRSFGWRSIIVGLVPLACAILLAREHIGNTSFWLDAAGYGIYLAMLGVVAVASAPTSRTFHTYLAISLAIAVGITGSGIYEAVRDTSRKTPIPSELIFWQFSSDRDPACQ